MKFKTLSLLLGILFIASCGGGSSGGDEEEGEGTPTPPPSETPAPIQDQNLRLTSADPSVNEGDLRMTRFSAVDLNGQRLLARTIVNVAAGGEVISSAARAYAQFTARSDSAALVADIDWFGTLLSAVNLSATTEMRVVLKVREVNPNGSLGTEIFSRQLERDGIGSGLKGGEKLDVRGNVNQGYQLSLKEGQPYRVVVEAHCRIQVDGISFALIDCNAETGGRGVNVNDLVITY